MTEIRKLILSSEKPLLFKKFHKNLEILHWTLEEWSECIGNVDLEFRKGFECHSEIPQWESICTTEKMNFETFRKLFEAAGGNKDFWLYYDYKYLFEHLECLPEFSWSDFGFSEKTKKDSTIWIGSKCAHTCCHVDTYSVNLITQIYGRKQWILYSPETDLEATRVPYEESTIFSKLNFFSPSERMISKLHPARVITLEVGDTLLLPSRWWHYAECDSDISISVNTWIATERDDLWRFQEAIVQYSIKNLIEDAFEDDDSVLERIVTCSSKSILKATSKQLLAQMKECYRVLKSKRNCQRESKQMLPDVAIPDQVFEVSAVHDHSSFEQFLKSKTKKLMPEFKTSLAFGPDQQISFLHQLINAYSSDAVVERIANSFQ